ncbi:MAG: calcium-binding protein [Pseudomonadota bacterium]
MARIDGTSGNDTLTGTNENDQMFGYAGNDFLQALAGNDELFGGDGDDRLEGGDGDDVLIGGAGKDQLVGGNGSDTVTATYADTSIYGNTVSNAGNLGDFDIADLSHINMDQTTIDSIAYDAKSFTVEDGTILFTFKNREHNLYASNGDKELGAIGFEAVRLNIENGAKVISAMGDLNVIVGTDGQDNLEGTISDDLIFGLGGDDEIKGNDGDDQLYGGSGDDTVDGEDGDDVLIGGEGVDTLIGGFGNDTILASFDDEAIYGNDINNNGKDGDVDVADFSETTINQDTKEFLSTVVDHSKTTIENGTILFTFKERNVDFTAFNLEGQSLEASDFETIRLNVEDGSEVISLIEDHSVIYGTFDDDVRVGTALDDRIYGLAGNDELRGGSGMDLLVGGDGDDELHGGNDIDLLQGRSGDDFLYGGEGGDFISGGGGIDTLKGGKGNDVLEGDDGDDTLYGDNGDDELKGGAGNDYINGGAGNDELEGGDGDDILIGGDGNDVLVGGAGVDGFLGGLGSDIIVADLGDDVADGGVSSNDNDIDTLVLTSEDHLDQASKDVLASIITNYTINANGTITLRLEDNSDFELSDGTRTLRVENMDQIELNAALGTEIVSELGLQHYVEDNNANVTINAPDYGGLINLSRLTGANENAIIQTLVALAGNVAPMVDNGDDTYTITLANVNAFEVPGIGLTINLPSELVISSVVAIALNNAGVLFA